MSLDFSMLWSSLKSLSEVADGLMAIATWAGFILLLVGLHQLNLMKKSLNLQASLDLLKEYRHDLWASRLFAKTKLRSDIKSLLKENPKIRYSNLPDDIRVHIENLSHYYDEVGLLISRGLVDEDIVLSYFGGSALDTFRQLYPLIINERNSKKDGIYQEYYEDMVRRVVEKTQIKRLRTKRLTLKQLSDLDLLASKK